MIARGSVPPGQEAASLQASEDAGQEAHCEVELAREQRPGRECACKLSLPHLHVRHTFKQNVQSRKHKLSSLGARSTG